MYKASVVSDVTRPGYNRVNSTRTNVRIMYDNGPRGAKNEINIVLREKQTDVDNQIYYTSKQEQNSNDARQN